MVDIDINDLATLGVLNDVPPYMLPPEAWTLALNVRYTDDGVESLLGWESVFGTPLAAPHFLMPVSTESDNFWIYTSATDAYVYDGTMHADISRVGNYSATETRQWNGTILGGIPIINNGIDVPQYRANMTPGTLFANLLNWPGTLRTRVMRSFAPYLMAFSLVDTGVALPHTIQWSHPADPGALPASWDFTDPTRDAGRKDLDDINSGVIVEALQLGAAMFVYKENSTWRAVQIGGRFVFDWKPIFTTSGILAPRCVASTGDGKRHCVATQDDLVYHNGVDMVSVVDKKQRARLFQEMDPVNYVNSFLTVHPLANEMWFCYPTVGFINPNKALIWNYKHNAISYADGITFRNGAIGNIEGDTSELWSDGTDEWSEDTGPWTEFSRRRFITVGTDASKFYGMDRTSTRDGVAFISTLQREALSVIGRKRTGGWIVDYQRKKLLQRLWPKVQGGPINVRVGASETVDGAIAWGTAIEFDPASQVAADVEPVSGRALSIEYSTNNSNSWRIDGYKLQLALLGQH